MLTFKEFLLEDNNTVEEFSSKGPRTKESVNGLAFKKWDAPTTHEGWKNVEGQNHDINEPPVPKLEPGMKFSTGLIMHEPCGRVWLTKPTNAFGGYEHTFPKGNMEKGLHPQANAIKETHEETGLKARVTGHAIDAAGTTSVTRYYHAVRTGGDPHEHGWESEAIKLVPHHELDNHLNMPRDKKIAKHLMKAKEER